MGNFQMWIIFDPDCCAESRSFFSWCLMDISPRYSWAVLKFKSQLQSFSQLLQTLLFLLMALPFLRHSDTEPLSLFLCFISSLLLRFNFLGIAKTVLQGSSTMSLQTLEPFCVLLFSSHYSVKMEIVIFEIKSCGILVISYGSI